MVDTGDDQCADEMNEVYSAASHFDKVIASFQFNPNAYLESFYKTASEDSAMQIVLFFLPGILYRLPEKVKTALDLGAGPTVYLPIVLRNKVLQIYTSDYARVNRDVLQSWIENRSTFDWSEVCHWISSIEAVVEQPFAMQQQARDKVMAILEANVHETPVIRSVHWRRDNCEIPQRFELVSTIFCLEYSCETIDEYNRAVQGACSLIEHWGYLIQGGVMDATSYNFGGLSFKCHRLKRNHIEDALKANGMTVKPEEGFKFITHDGIFLLISRKIMS
ncbi:NNMT/PNMT/TEMT family protein [Dictyocaulus viviparus]|uniref:NNMT/PNMT/TEMT family protein n=1 Tax=Dictyocaulus viviparus TaxID=29172 RepID=A0A0D8XXC7_DICVI|nr:NNMT/PNMT/TEMT family protein [Dictyocaulus viviparus]